MISSRDLRQAFGKTGKILASQDLRNLMREYSKENESGQHGINYEGFKDAILAGDGGGDGCPSQMLEIDENIIEEKSA